MAFVYLACPYSHPDKQVRKNRYRLANSAAAHLMAEGHTVFSPVSHGHGIEKFLPEGVGGHDFWMNQCREMLRRADVLVIVAVEGATESKGIEAEITLALQMGLPIDYLVPETDEDDAPNPCDSCAVQSVCGNSPDRC